MRPGSYVVNELMDLDDERKKSLKREFAHGLPSGGGFPQGHVSIYAGD